MKFRYYITDLNSGCVLGSNSTETADSFRVSEEHFVVDAETGKWLTTDEEVEVRCLEA